jgi:hypothetical protein
MAVQSRACEHAKSHIPHLFRFDFSPSLPNDPSNILEAHFIAILSFGIEDFTAFFTKEVIVFGCQSNTM